MSDDMKIDRESIYTIGAAARLLNVSPSTLRDLERRGHVVTDTGPPETICRFRTAPTPG